MSAWRAVRILAVGGAAAVGLLGLVTWEARARAQGTEVRLAMEAVDPRGLLSGHYAEIQLRDQLPEGASCPPDEEWGEGEWVVLRPVGDRHRAEAAFAVRSDAARHGPGVVVRGRLECQDPGAVVRADLGVERFHADRTEAEAIEDALRAARGTERTPEAYAVISVGRDGRARLKGVIVRGRRVDLDWF